MTIQEILEAAHLGAMGLLEDDEHQAFEAALAAANPAVQAQVRAEQARWALTAASFVDAEPPAYLRERVVSAVGAAMGEARADDTAALMSESQLGREIAAADASGHRVGRVDGRPKTPRVSPMWRAASLGFATAAAVLLAAFLSVSGQVDSLQQRFTNDSVLEATTQGLGRAVFEEAMYGPGVERYSFTLPAVVPASQGAAAGSTGGPAATIFLLPKRYESQLYVKGLAVGIGQSARVVVLDDAGNIVSELQEFPVIGKIATTNLSYEATKGKRLGIAVANVGAKATKDDVRLVVRTA